jgi:hypothetical protein
MNFSSKEHFIAYKQALLFGASTVADRLLQVNTPKAINRLVREIKAFKPDVWEYYVDEAEEEWAILCGDQPEKVEEAPVVEEDKDSDSYWTFPKEDNNEEEEELDDDEEPDLIDDEQAEPCPDEDDEDEDD